MEGMSSDHVTLTVSSEAPLRHLTGCDREGITKASTHWPAYAKLNATNGSACERSPGIRLGAPLQSPLNTRRNSVERRLLLSVNTRRPLPNVVSDYRPYLEPPSPHTGDMFVRGAA